MKTYIIPLIMLLGSFASCGKWLDIRPETQVDQDELFSTQTGFEEALIGIYTRCTENDLYGKELTIGTPEVLAQNYNTGFRDPYGYEQTSRLLYNDGHFIARKDDIWKGLYHAIVNCNVILEHIDKRPQLFSPGMQALIKGEALALRAYLHFDALRLFAPSFASGPQAEGIPYVTQYGNLTTPIATVSSVLDSVIKDLVLAKQLLNEDPIRDAGYIVGYPTVSDTLKNTEARDPNLFLQNRRHRMNYFAVSGVLARVYLYKQDKANALIQANEVIGARKFPWTANADFLAIDDDKKDRILYKELVFAWYIPNKNFDYNDGWFRAGNSGMHLPQDAGRAIYEVAGAGATDQRYRQWLTTTSSNNVFSTEIHKYRRNRFSDSEQANLHYLMAPALRISELYYIAAECTYPSNPVAAAALVDEVRTVRGIGEPLSAANEEQFMDALVREYRKELFAEGQLFYTYKRLNRSFPTLNGVPIPASNAVFVLPLPNDEIQYGGR